MSVVVHLTTVHARNDVRIALKEVRTVAANTAHSVAIVVADGLGSGRAGDGTYVHDLGSLPKARALRALAGSWRALVTIRELRPRLIHFHDPELIPLGLTLKAMGYSVIYDAHEDLPRQILGKYWIPGVLRYPVALLAGMMEASAGRLCDGIVAATPTIACRFPEPRRALVPNYPLVEELAPPGVTPYALRPNTFVYIGGIAHIRGAREMVRAVSRVNHRETRLELAGRFDRPSTADDLRALEGWTSTDYRGQLDRIGVGELLSRARGGLVVLHPLQSYMDAWPIKLFEYMAAGIPVIASDFPVWREFVDRERCGILVDPMDVDAIADAMTWIVDHPDEAEEMGARGRRAVAERYNWNSAAGELIGLYQRIIR